jgi:hypothetical protein
MNVLQNELPNSDAQLSMLATCYEKPRNITRPDAGEVMVAQALYRRGLIDMERGDEPYHIDENGSICWRGYLWFTITDKGRAVIELL